MNEPTAPEWAIKRDGRQVPFEADRISRALFAAGEAIGRADAFLARELADGVVHFLTQESDGPPTTAQIEEVVIKVVRELGHPALAESYASFAQRRQRNDRTQPAAAETARQATAPGREVVLRFAPEAPLTTVLAECARAYALQAIFTRDLVAAHNEGLVVLAGLSAPGELASGVLAPPPAGGDWLSAFEEARRVVGGLVALDGPEYALVGGGERGPSDLARAVAMGQRLTGLQVVVNLNIGSPPSWADELAVGPLFQERATVGPAEVEALAGSLFEELLGQRTAAVRIDWHLSQRDFAPAPADRLERVARRALEGGAVGFVFDRPRRPVALAEGLDRRGPAVLLTVGLNLPALAKANSASDEDRFLRRLGSLARLGLSAAVQKRDFLRRQEQQRPGGAPAVTSGFLLDRARLVVSPLGLDEVVALFHEGRGLASGGPALDLGRRVVLRLRDVLRQDGRAAQMDTCLDGPFDFRLAAGTVAGLTPWSQRASAKAQVRAGGALHGAAEHGTLALFVPEDQPASAAQVAGWLREAWERTELVRLRLVRPAAVQGELATLLSSCTQGP
jgi:hypothetical protein